LLFDGGRRLPACSQSQHDPHCPRHGFTSET
jgi:hypothetical protein